MSDLKSVFSVNKNRDNSLDLVKGMGIILLILGHITDGDMQRVIYSFHMPLFVIVSGLLFSKCDSPLYIVEKKLKSLIFPYISFNTILIVIGFIGLLMDWTCVWWCDNTRSMLAALFSFVCGKGISVTWFLSFLFIVYVIEGYFQKKRYIVFLLWTFGVLGGHALAFGKSGEERVTLFSRSFGH